MKNRALQGVVTKLRPANNTECASADGNGEWVATTIRQAKIRMRSRERSRWVILDCIDID